MNTFKHAAGCISEIYKNIQKVPLTLIWDSISLAWILQVLLLVVYAFGLWLVCF